MENEIPKNNTLVSKLKAKLRTPVKEVAPVVQKYSFAVITHVKDNMPVSVAQNGNNYFVTGYLSTMPGIAPCMSLGDKVLVSALGEGVLIHGVVMPVDAPIRASFSIVDGKLVIEAQEAIIFKCGGTTIEMSADGIIRTDARIIRTIAEDELTLQGSNLKLN